MSAQRYVCVSEQLISDMYRYVRHCVDTWRMTENMMQSRGLSMILPHSTYRAVSGVHGTIIGSSTFYDQRHNLQPNSKLTLLKHERE